VRRPHAHPATVLRSLLSLRSKKSCGPEIGNSHQKPSQITAFVEHYNHQCYHESPGKLTPADVYLGGAQSILGQRKKIKAQTIETRLLLHLMTAA